MISGEGDIHIVAWPAGRLDPTSSPTARADGVKTAGGEIIKNYRIIPFVGSYPTICLACQEAIAELRARKGQAYAVRYIQATKAIAPALAPSFSPQYD